MKLRAADETAIFTGEDLLRLKKTQQEERAARKEAQEERKASREARSKAKQVEKERRERENSWKVCQGSGHTAGKKPKWTTKKKWVWCQYCNRFGICDACANADDAAMAEHELNCDQRKSKRKQKKTAGAPPTKKMRV